MNLQKITKIGCIALGVLGIIFLFLVFGTGDDTIKMSAASGCRINNLLLINK
jgi:hypothetical protein